MVKRGSEPQWCGSNIHETSYSELCRMHTWCSENGIALVTYQEILNKMKVQMICSLEAYRNLGNHHHQHFQCFDFYTSISDQTITKQK